MSYRMVVLAKQVPDTANITGDAMKDDGTVNRAALPAVFNPDDMYALEAALGIRDAHGGTVTLVTMGPPQAGAVLREGLYRGVDEAILVSDMRAAASDTLATSYILSCAVRTCGEVDIVLCGRQAIDGDTAQVGPQIAEKLGLVQLTYVEEIQALENGRIRVKRLTDRGVEVVEGPLPALLTVVDTAKTPRPPSLKRVMQFKHHRAPAEVAAAVRREYPDAGDAERAEVVDGEVKALSGRGLILKQWKLEDMDAEADRCGREGSPTMVRRIQAVVLTAQEPKRIEPTDEGISSLIHELIEDHTLG